MTTESPDLSRLKEDPPPAPSESVQDYAAAEALAYDREKALHEATAARLEVAKRDEEIANLKQDRNQRKWFSILLFALVTLWLAAMIIIVAFDGASSKDTFDVSDIVLTTLIGTTTGSVLGLFWVVANYLFSRR